METKNEALELAQNLEQFLDGSLGGRAADMLRSQAAEIDRLEVRVGQLLCERSDYTQTVIAERDQLKAKNEKLVAAVETVCEGFTLHPSARKILETGLHGTGDQA